MVESSVQIFTSLHYRNEAQFVWTHGYALGAAGNISTPYWHAIELLD